MMKNKLVLIAAGLITVSIFLRDLPAQTPGSTFPQSYENAKAVDFSTLSRSSLISRSTFEISAEVVDPSMTISTLEATNNLDGSLQDMGLSISPARIVFENGQKTAEMTITNIGSLNTIYRIGLVNTIFDEDGQRELVDPEIQADFEKQGARFADKMLKFAPRWVRLKPTEQQLIRVAAVLPDKLEDGEYRSELKFSWQKDCEELSAQGSLEEILEQNTASSTEPKIDDNADKKNIFIPLIIRQGNLSATAQLTELQLESSDEGTVLNLRILREGNRSLYGDLLIFGLNKQNEKTGILHTVSNVAIYPPSSNRDLSVDLTEALSKDGINIESLLIEYKAKENTDNNVIIASSSINFLNNARVSARKISSSN